MIASCVCGEEGISMLPTTLVSSHAGEARSSLSDRITGLTNTNDFDNEFMGTEAEATVIIIQKVMGTSANGKTSGMKASKSSIVNPKLSKGKGNKGKGNNLPRVTGLKQQGLLAPVMSSEDAIECMIRNIHTCAYIMDPIRKHAEFLRGDDWDTEYVNISIDELVSAMLGFVFCRAYPMDMPTDIISQFKPVYVDGVQDYEATEVLERNVVFGFFLNYRKIRHSAFLNLWPIMVNLPSECFMCLTLSESLDVVASTRALCAILEPSSELYTPVPKFEVLCAVPQPSKDNQKPKQRKQEKPVVEVPVVKAATYRCMPNIELVVQQVPTGTPCAIGKVDSKVDTIKSTGTFKEDDKSRAEDLGNSMLAKTAKFNKRSDRKAGTVNRTDKLRSIDETKQEDETRYTLAELQGLSNEGLSVLKFILSKVGVLPEKIIRERTQTLLKKMCNEKAFAAFLNGCNAENSPHHEIYAILCYAANSGWKQDFLTAFAMFFRDMIWDVQAFNDYLMGEYTEQMCTSMSEDDLKADIASQLKSMEFLRGLLPAVKLCNTETVNVSIPATPAVIAPIVQVSASEKKRIMEEEFM